MRILALSWRDIRHPQTGGAETYTHEMLSRIAAQWIEIVHLSPKVSGIPEDEDIDGVHYMRRWGILSIIFYAFFYYIFRGSRYDYIIDQANTHRFFTPLYIPRKKRIFFIHQLTREIWFYHGSHAPFPLNYFWYYLEDLLFFPYKKTFTWTVSDSTKKDLVALGFPSDNIEIIPEWINFAPWSWEQLLPKYEPFTFLYVGRFAKYKGIDDTIEAFGKLISEWYKARLKIVGRTNEDYKKSHLDPIIAKYDCADQVDFLGFQSEESKLEIMSRSHVIVVASIREGWGLIVTESNAVGTPALVYNSPGLVDAVKENMTWLVVSPNIEDLYNGMKKYMEDTEIYETLRKNAWEDSFNYHWDNTGRVAHESLIRHAWSLKSH